MESSSHVAPRRRWSERWRALLARVRAVPGETPVHTAASAADVAARRLREQRWPEPLLRVLARLREPEGEAYLVGGTVRDVVAGQPVAEPFDAATTLTPEQVMARFTRVEPIGLAHGTVLILEPGVRVECTTMRREGAYRDARHPDSVSFTRDLGEDLARRDFTINAMAFDPASGAFHDPHGGAADLEARRLRAVGDPLKRFHEDALRPLRAARFAAALDLALDADTERAMGGVGDRAALVAMERVRDEWERLLRTPHPSRGIELLRRAGLLERWAPELARCAGVPQNRYHAYDVYEHSLRTCDAAPAAKPRVRWAALLHDIGKPETRVVRDGEGTFYGHAERGAELADALLLRFRTPNDERHAIVHLVREHMFDFRREWSDAALRRWLRRVGVDAVADLFDLRLADVVGNGTRAGFPMLLEEMRARIEQLLREQQALSVRDLAIDGADVMRLLEVPPGPRVGEALEAMLQVVLEHPERNDRERLSEELRRWAEGRAPRGAEA
jgi:putative nucleotidyltransferase with HDIG domain